MTSVRTRLSHSYALFWASTLVFLSAAMGIALAVAAVIVVGSVDKRFDRDYGSPPTGAMKFGVVVTIIVSVLTIAYGVVLLRSSRTHSAAVRAAWKLFVVVVCTAFCSPGRFTDAVLYADGGGSGMFRWLKYVSVIPDWYPPAALTLAVGKVATFFAAGLVLSLARRREPASGDPTCAA